VPDRQLQRHEGAESIAENVDDRRQRKRIHRANDVVCVLAYRAQFDRIGRAEARQVETGHAVRLGKQRQYALEHAHLGEQRVQEQ